MSGTRVGRPRSERARLALLDAARDLVLEHGYESVSLVQIAASAGVSRQTIYRWWPTKEALVAEAVLVEALPLDPVLVADSGDLAHDLRGWVDVSIARIADGNAAALYRAMLAAAAVDGDAAARMDAAFAAPLREAVRTAFESAGRGEHAEVAADVLLGVMLNATIGSSGDMSRRIGSVVDLLMRGTDPAAPRGT